jgi:hypothetical protein
LRTLPFLLLYCACLLALLGLRWALPLLAEVVPASAPAPVEASMAMPPKPEGLAPEAVPAAGGSGRRSVTEADCLPRSGELRDLCFQILARQEGALDTLSGARTCARVADPELRQECLSDVAEAGALRDRSLSEQVCSGIESRKWRGQCHFGIGLALAETDSPYALGRCAHAEAFQDFCRHDVVGEVALVDLPAAREFCAREEGDELRRKTCWHGMGKYLARRDASEAASACGSATERWRGNCFHGLGWGAAERDVDAALSSCAGLGPFRDNCTQGVAHQQKRVDPARAVALCEGIATASVRERCLAFVRR